MSKILAKFSSALFLALSPFLILAQPPLVPTQGVPQGGRIAKLIENLGGWVDFLVPIVMVIAVLVFFWGIVMYITAGADEEKRGKARNLMIYGVIGLFVMVSIWGLVKFIGATLGVGQGTPVDKIGLPTAQ